MRPRALGPHAVLPMPNRVELSFWLEIGCSSPDYDPLRIRRIRDHVAQQEKPGVMRNEMDLFIRSLRQSECQKIASRIVPLLEWATRSASNGWHDRLT